jgi:NADPH-dependent curcumin reductase CurA
MPTYVEPVAIGAVMRAGTVGEVVTSRHPDFRQGDYVSDVAGGNMLRADEAAAVQGDFGEVA